MWTANHLAQASFIELTLKEDAQGRELAPVLGDLSQSEKHPEIKSTLE